MAYLANSFGRVPSSFISTNKPKDQQLMTKRLLITIVSVFFAMFCATTHAQLRIEISGVGSNQIPIAIAGFADENLAPQQVSAIIKADLERSGYFKIIDTGNSMSETSNINYSDWKTRGAFDLVIGSVQKLADGRFDVRYRLLDIGKQTQLSGFELTDIADHTRLTAHKIADDIYKKLTSVPGDFSTRVAVCALGVRCACRGLLELIQLALHCLHQGARLAQSHAPRSI